MIGTTTGLIDYAAGRGVAIDSADAAMLLTRATDALNVYKWVGAVADPITGDSWPRKNFVTDGSALDIGGVISAPASGEYIGEAATPVAVIQSAYRLAMAVADGVDLSPVMGLGDTTRETVGPITVEYAEGSLGGSPSFSWWDSVLGYWLADANMFAGNFDVFRG